MQHVQQPLQQEEGPKQSPLQKENQARKLLSKDEILNCIIVKEQEPKYKSGVPMLSKADLEAAGPNCARLDAYIMEHGEDKLTFPAKLVKSTFKVVVL
jgi:hypothetical protein